MMLNALRQRIYTLLFISIISLTIQSQQIKQSYLNFLFDVIDY